MKLLSTVLSTDGRSLKASLRIALSLICSFNWSMSQPERHICRTFHIDANRVNARSCLANMNKLERWHKDGVITLEMSEIAQSEAAVGSDQNRKSKAFEYIFAETLASTADEKKRLQEIEGILFSSGARSGRERNDVQIVFSAIKYEAILVTNDGDSRRQPRGMLGNREKLKKLGVEILRDDEAVRLVQDLIKKRDERTCLYCERQKIPVPDWIGNDSGE
jgi:predicted nucleic acid-binding protein